MGVPMEALGDPFRVHSGFVVHFGTLLASAPTQAVFEVCSWLDSHRSGLGVSADWPSDSCLMVISPS